MPKRPKISISLSPAMQQWVDDIVNRAGYETSSDYIADLVRKDRRRRLREQIDAELLQSLDAPSVESSSRVWSRLKQRIRRRGKQNKSRHAA